MKDLLVSLMGVIPDRDEKAAAEFTEYLQRFIGIEYFYSGDDPVGGFDCSGLINEGLRRGGKLIDSERLNAAMLMNVFKSKEIAGPKKGALVFYGTIRADHVAACIDDKTMIEAGGGTSGTDTRKEAIARNAFVRERPIDRRTDILGFFDPWRLK